MFSRDDLSNLEMRMGKRFNPLQVQTYTTVGGVPFLDYEYTVFGEVIEGLDIIDKIATQDKDRADRPAQDIKMTIRVVE